jgi:hypothetical protein
MGMEQRSHWACDRCGKEVFAKVTEVPKGWEALITPAPIAVDPEDFRVDMKLGFDKKFLCGPCILQYREWLHLDEAEPVAAIVEDVKVVDTEPPTAPPTPGQRDISSELDKLDQEFKS